MNAAIEIERDQYGRRPHILTNQEEALIRKAHVVTPSSINSWFGTWEEGAAFSNQQLVKMREFGLDPDLVERIVVQVKVNTREWYWNAIDPTPIRLITCPVIRPVGDRVEVIAPRGHVKRVFPNGQLTRPRKRRIGGSIGRG